MKIFFTWLFVSVASIATAATFTFTDPNCTDFSYANGTLSCVTTEPPKPPDPPASLVNCTNQNMSVIGPVDIPWGAGFSSLSGYFSANTVWLFRLIVPASAPVSNGSGYMNVVENAGPPTIRQATISQTPCDYRTKDYTGAAGPLGISQGVTVTLYYNTVPPQPFGGVAGLTPGSTYYVSIRNYSTDLGGWSCVDKSCDAIMNAQPQGAPTVRGKVKSKLKQKMKAKVTPNK